MTRVVFMGTPEFAVPSLDALCDAGYDVVGVVTQPDRPAGRGKKLTPCPVKLRAEERGLSVCQFERIRRPEGVECLKALAPDVAVTAAFGQILTQELLDIPRMGVINVHASLLPGYRGSAPINWMLLNGETQAGVSIMRTDIGIDTGDVLSRRATPIGEMETAGELTARLAALGAELLAETLPQYLAGEIVPEKQDEAAASYYPMLKKEMGEIDWTRSAVEIANQARGLNPWPGAFTELNGSPLKLHLARPLDDDSDAAPGSVIASGAKVGLIVKCGAGAVEVLELQAQGGKRMAAKAYLAGRRINVGTRLGKDGEP